MLGLYRDNGKYNGNYYLGTMVAVISYNIIQCNLIEYNINTIYYSILEYNIVYSSKTLDKSWSQV